MYNQEGWIRYQYRYDPKTGVITDRFGRVRGSYAAKYGKLFTKVGTFTISRVAYFLVHDEWPQGEMDHIDGNTHNDKWDNLRECSRSENAKNRRAYVNNTTGYKGVYTQTYKGKTTYIASIQVDNKRMYLGSFRKDTDAALAYNKSALELHGNFASLNIIEENHSGS